MTKICDEKLVTLQLSHDMEEDALRVSFVIGLGVDVEPLAPAAHVITVVSQRTEDLFPDDQANEGDFDDRSLCTLSVCDPGGLLGTPGHDVLEVLIDELVERSWLESDVLAKVEGGEQKE
jgi:hypothetical protein